MWPLTINDAIDTLNHIAEQMDTQGRYVNVDACNMGIWALEEMKKIKELQKELENLKTLRVE